MSERRLLAIEWLIAFSGFITVATVTALFAGATEAQLNALLGLELLLALTVSLKVTRRLTTWWASVANRVSLKDAFVGASCGLIGSLIIAVAGANKATVFSDSGFTLVAVMQSVLLAPLIEEIIFRGYVLWSVKRGFGTNVGVAISTLLFALAHLPNGGGTVLAASGLGVVLAWLALSTRSLIPGMLAHAVFNMTQFLVAVQVHHGM